MVSTGLRWNKVTGRMVTATLGAALILVGVGCRPDASTARGTAERFLDAHYVHIDLKSTLPFAAGVARHKVEEEIALVGEQAIDDSTRKPRVHYRLLDERPSTDGAVSFVYHGSIAVEDAEPLERRWLLTVRHEGNDWRVTNYQEVAE